MPTGEENAKAALEALGRVDTSTMDEATKTSWDAQVKALAEGYEQAKKATDDTKKQKAAELFEKNGAKMVNGIISAQKAFAKGDAVSGAADIMEICASAAQFLTLIPGGGAIAGPLVGGIFSIVGSIIRAFAPKQPSDVDKLKVYLQQLEAESHVTKVEAARLQIMAYSGALRSMAGKLQDALKQPLRTSADYGALLRHLAAAQESIAGFRPHDSISMFTEWDAVAYLRNPANQNETTWPELLVVVCQVYADIAMISMLLQTVVNSREFRAAVVATTAPESLTPVVAPGKPAPPTPKAPDAVPARDAVNVKLQEVAGFVDGRLTDYQACHKVMLDALEGLVGTIQRWGVFAHIGTNQRNLYFASGPGQTRNGPWTRVEDGLHHRLTFFGGSEARDNLNGRAPAGSPGPRLHVLTLKSDDGDDMLSGHHWADHAWLDTRKLHFYDTRNILDNFTADGLSAIAVNAETPEGLHVIGGTGSTRPGATGGSVTAFRLARGKDAYDTAKLVRDNWWPPVGGPVISVAPVAVPAAVVGDPDAAALRVGGASSMYYMAVRGSNTLYVSAPNSPQTIPGPTNWAPPVQIAADENFLWYFQPRGFAVVTHASVVQHLKDPSKPVNWIGTETSLLDIMKDGIVSASPCEDGTLFVATRPKDKPESMHTATYEIDVAAHTISVGQWSRLPGEALYVQKAAMPGWRIVRSLMHQLQAG